jgi:LuxR family maltose regulon positive regulatory protein
MAEVLREWNDLDAAASLVRQGIARCVQSRGLAEMALDGSLTLARILQARGKDEEALAVLQQAEADGHTSHVLQATERVDAARARLWLTGGVADVPAAQRWAEQRGPVWAADDQSGYVGLLEQVMLARLHLVQGRRGAAAALLRKLRARAEAGGLTGSSIEILLMQARLHQEQNQEVEALIALGCALALAESAGYVRLFVDEGPPIIRLLRRAQRRGVAPTYVARLLVACGAANAPDIPPGSGLIDPLSAREREIVGLLASGLSTAEIAGQLFVTAGTVRNHLKNIFGKLDVHSRLQAVERARALQLL